MNIFTRVKKWRRRRRYQVGETITRFLAPDIRREVKIIDISKIEEGLVTAQVRTWNALYVVNEMNAIPDLSPSQLLKIDTLWDWTGELWGGPVPGDDEAI